MGGKDMKFFREKGVVGGREYMQEMLYDKEGRRRDREVLPWLWEKTRGTKQQWKWVKRKAMVELQLPNKEMVPWRCQTVQM